MRTLTLFFSISFLFLVNIHFAEAQKKPTQPGSVKGALKDTVQKYILRTATISVYNVKDSSLINYQLSNAYAEFNVPNLPVGIPLKLEVSHTGYTIFEKKFTIPADAKTYDFKTIYMKPQNITLKDVEIRVPPITMNGDTLEINPAAFKLDSNAVIEDVLRRTPGLELWGDGVITFNGRAIKNVYVDGKQFFGGDPKVALQNLPNQVIQKVQVYREPNEKNLRDSTLTMNIKLKKNKKSGMFGKTGGGYGTDDRYETDASINIYNAKMQIGIVAASNNVNKTAENANDLLESSTYKGVGANIDYQSDFRANGINQPTAAGVNFKYDFFEDPKWDKTNTLTADYFVQRQLYKNNTDNQTITTIGDADKIYNTSQNKNEQTSNDQKFNARYLLNTDHSSFNISSSYNPGNRVSSNRSLSNSFNNENSLVSANGSTSNERSTYKYLNFSMNYNQRNYNYNSKIFPLFRGMSVQYDFNLSDRLDENNNISDFKSFVNPSTNRLIDRRYQNPVNDMTHKIRIELPSISNLIRKNGLQNLNIALINNLKLNTNKNQNNVSDLDSLTGAFRGNSYLSNNLKTDLIEELPELRIQKSFYKQLSNRFYQNLSISASAIQNVTNQNTTSIKDFQNINKTYSRFLPSASISAQDNQYGAYYRSASISYSTSMQIPEIWQLAPLTDSTQVYNLRRGNLNLKEATTQSISFNFNHNDNKTKNAFNMGLGGNFAFIKNAIVDSIIIDAQNRREVYNVNISGQKSLNVYANINKAITISGAQLQFRLNTGLNSLKSPSVTNGAINFSRSISNYNNLTIYYSFKDKLALEAKTSMSFSKSKQLLFNTQYTSQTYSNMLSTSYNVTKKLNFSSNITLNKNTSSNNEDINFAIWNASAIYRLLKGNNVEIKISALDLLHQNTQIINYTNSNSLTTGTQTVLQQYFMATLSYYPRLFGLAGK
ncbi:hypothetical protein ACVWYG_001434 [Pedobacter sp. UYEF25]